MKIELVKYIIRNITRKKKQSFFTLLSISVSSFIILINIAQNNGIQSQLKAGINQAISGQLTLYSTKDSTLNILESQLNDQESFKWKKEYANKLINNIENISIDRRIRFGSLVSFEDETTYTNIHALEESHLNRIATLLDLSPSEIPLRGNHILVSQSLAENLNCKAGDTILLVANNMNDYMSDDLAVVSRIFEEKGLATMLNYTSFIPYGFDEEMVQLDEEACVEVIINSTNNFDIPHSSTQKINQQLTELVCTASMANWDQTVPLLSKIVNIWEGGGYVTQTLFILFSLVILVNLISLIINARRKEFGTLLAIGFSWRKITILISVEYLIITIAAIIASYMAVLFLIELLPENGIYMASKDLQSALLSEYLQLIVHFKDFAYTSLLFCTTTLLALFINILRVRHLKPITLINKQ